MTRRGHAHIASELERTTGRRDVTSDSRLIVTGQSGCGKTSLAKRISALVGVPHIHIDDYHGDVSPMASAARAAGSITGGWVAEACVWQIPRPIWDAADLVIFLDYANSVHYRRILRRCLRSCLAKPTWNHVREVARSEWGHLKIMYRYADENRAGWQKQGGITDATVPVVRFVTSRETEIWLAELARQFG